MHVGSRWGRLAGGVGPIADDVYLVVTPTLAMQAMMASAEVMHNVMLHTRPRKYKMSGPTLRVADLRPTVLPLPGSLATPVLSARASVFDTACDDDCADGHHHTWRHSPSFSCAQPGIHESIGELSHSRAANHPRAPAHAHRANLPMSPHHANAPCHPRVGTTVDDAVFSCC